MRSSAEIQADLEAAYTARRVAMQAQSYSLDTGQGKQSVNRADLDKISKTISILQLEFQEALDYESGICGITYGDFGRY